MLWVVETATSAQDSEVTMNGVKELGFKMYHLRTKCERTMDRFLDFYFLCHPQSKRSAFHSHN